MAIEIHTGDALAIVPTLGEFDAVVTDPPYSSGSTRKEWRSGNSVEAALYAASRTVKQGGLMIVASASSGRSIERIVSAVAPSLPFARVLCWNKPHTRCRVAGPWGWQTVLWLVFGKLGGAFVAPDNIQAEAMQYKRQGTTGHPAELPVAVCDWLALGLSTRLSQGARVLDPFCGSGAILKALHRKGFDPVGVEINPEWSKLAGSGVD